MKILSMHKTTFLLITIIISNRILFSQSIDFIQMNNGELYKGTIIEQKPGGYIKVIIPGEADTLLLKMSDIQKINNTDQNEINLNSDHINSNFFESPNLQKFYTYAGSQFSFNNKNAFGFVGIGVAKRMNKRLNFNIGVEYFTNFKSTFIPITLGGRLLFHSIKKNSAKSLDIYGHFALGGNFAFKENQLKPNTALKSGLSYCRDFGIGIAFNKKYFIDLTYRKTKNNTITDEKGNNNFINTGPHLRFGFLY